MRLIELEIQNVRGIRHLKLLPAGANFVVRGPNGSGKSAVVDAVDFLLTGRITRLTGRGTGSITLSKHGPHIDFKPGDATVRALIQPKGVQEPIEIKRCIAKPNVLECDEDARPLIEPIMAIARRGQYVLTRREILKYITAEGSTRAEEIQELLNITDIEDIRKAFIKVQHDIKTEHQVTVRSLETAQADVNATLQIPSFDRSRLLDVVNHNRAIIGASPIPSPHSALLKSNIRLPTAVFNERAINVTLLESDIRNLQETLSESNQASMALHEEQLRSTISLLNSDPLLLRAFKQRQLITLGLNLIDESGKCPLCDKAWEQGKLQEHLKLKRSSAQAAEQHQSSINEEIAAINARINTILAIVKKAIAAAQIIGLGEQLEILKLWQINLESFSNILDSPSDGYLKSGFSPDRIKRLFAPDNLSETLARMLDAIKTRFPESTPEQTAWDILTRLEGDLKRLEKAEASHKAAQDSYRRASIMLQTFHISRDNVLKKLYDTIKDRFVELYKKLHGEDEGQFDARLEPEDAALTLEVDFYGRGKHAPHALHSEGHQDSMGFCLYLALAEELTGGIIDLIILDDVVMSVDTDHRRGICRLLAEEFSSKQFLITTHDRTWANQLKSEGVLSSKGIVEFRDWKVETGPLICNEVGDWKEIENDILSNDIPAAASKLRRWSEGFFANVCDALHASVQYKLNGRLELGDFLPAGVHQYKQLLKRAKEAGQSWKDKETVKMLSEQESTIGQIYKRTNAEQWAINASVHYNEWASLSPGDFRPVFESFQDLCGVFTCSNCRGMLYVASDGPKLVSIKCKCGKVNWNLQKNSAN